MEEFTTSNVIWYWTCLLVKMPSPKKTMMSTDVEADDEEKNDTQDDVDEDQDDDDDDDDKFLPVASHGLPPSHPTLQPSTTPRPAFVHPPFTQVLVSWSPHSSLDCRARQTT